MNSITVQKAAAIFFLLMSMAACAQTGYMDPPGAPGSEATRMKTLNQVEPRTAITQLPYEITNAGSYYVTMPLTGCANSNGITISSDHVRIDLCGFPLLGVSNSLSGVYVSVPVANVTVRNGMIHEWKQYGLNATNAKDVAVSDLKTYHNGFGGIYVGYNSSVERCSSWGNGFATNATVVNPAIADGIQVGGYTRVIDCSASMNMGSGIHTYIHSRVSGCTATESYGASGIYTEDYCTVRDCSVSRNLMSGIRVGSKCRVAGNTCGENGFNNVDQTAPGISIEGSNSMIEDNILVGNNIGIQVSTNPPSAFGNLVLRNSASKNISKGVNKDYVTQANNFFGPIEDLQGTFTNANPWTNFKFSTF